MAAPSRLAAALDYLERLKSQADQYGNQTQMQTANVGKEFLSGVGQNLAERAKGLGQMGYEAFSQPTQPYATTAEISAQPRNTPIIDETTMALGRAGKALATDPIGTGKAMVMGEVERAKGATQNPMAAGEYAGSFIDPMRLVRALKAPQQIAAAVEAIPTQVTALEVPEVLHGSPMRGLANLSPSKSMEVRGATWFSDNPEVADQYTFPREYGEILYDAEPGEVYKAGLSFKKPMMVDMEGKVGDAVELSKLVKKAKEEGYDGLILRNVDDSVDSSKLLGTSYAVFDPSQIKLKKK
jgi:hypothetical protein